MVRAAAGIARGAIARRIEGRVATAGCAGSATEQRFEIRCSRGRWRHRPAR